jgi:hypothetical protein
MRATGITLTLCLLFTSACADGGEQAFSPASVDLAVAADATAQPAVLPSPAFGLAPSPDGGLFVAEVFTGVTELRKGTAGSVAALPGVSGVTAIGRSNLFAVTGGPQGPPTGFDQTLFRISRGNVRAIADLDAYEHATNPDQIWNTLPPESNPFNVASMGGGKVLVADAAANDILVVDERGNIDWVAVLTPQLASTAPFKALIGCPNPAPECSLPPQIPAQPVATSIAIGPDGAYYAGELTGFPSPPGISRIWRIEPGARHAVCPGPECTQVVGGLTSIMDLAFGPDGTLYVAELDADGWLAVEVLSGGGPLAPVAGGTVKACDVGTGACSVVASGLSLSAAVTVDKRGTVWVAENSGIPGSANVHPLP